jgi:DNA-binding transcriptional LysR family regulator
MTALEARLGTRLFERQGRGYVLTADGENLAEAVRRMESEALSVERRLQGRDSALSGVVRLSATEGIGALWLPQRLRRFQKQYPDIDIELVLDNTEVNLSRREADVAIRMRQSAGTLPWQDALVGRRLGVLRVALYASPDYLAEHGTPASVDDLSQHATVTLDSYMAAANYNEWFIKASGGRRSAFASNSLLAQLQAVRAGFGIGVIASGLVTDELGLAPVLPDVTLPAPEVWLLFHADLKQSARIRAVVDFLAEEITADPQLLLP